MRPAVEIEVEHISKSWGSVSAVRDVSFVVPAGTFVALLGPSGCGKSTTLRLIAGLERVTGGRIRIGGEDVTNLPPARRRLAMVFQSYALFPHLSVAENIVFGLRVRRVPRSERKQRLAQVSELLGLTRLLDRKPAQLSGGQQQRVALGRAVIAEAPVCLMDEPLSNLDAQLRGEMRAELRSLQQKLGITMVYVTHDQTEAMSMADRVILMRDGAIEQDARPDELYARPASVFAARFIGSPPMNLIPFDALRGPHSQPELVGAGKAGSVLGIRPEDVWFAEDGVPVRVLSCEFMGADTLVKCAIGSTSMIARVPGRMRADTGTRLHARWEPKRVHVFDPNTGSRQANSDAEIAFEHATRTGGN
jgi:sn-glycerol 3-phosphate transport system ATP-binding protein